MIAGLLVACVGRQPFLNEPPRLLSVNEQVVARNVVLVKLDDLPVPGEPYELRLEVEDPERDRVEILFPEAAGEVAFDPDERSGVWIPPPDRVVAWLRIYLQDDGSPPAGETYDLSFGGLGGSGG